LGFGLGFGFERVRAVELDSGRHAGPLVLEHHTEVLGHLGRYGKGMIKVRLRYG